MGLIQDVLRAQRASGGSSGGSSDDLSGTPYASSGGGGGGRASGGKSAKAPKSKTNNPNKALIRLTARLLATSKMGQKSGGAQTDYGATARIADQIQQAYQGYSAKQVRQSAQQGGLTPEQSDAVVKAAVPYKSPLTKPVGTALDYLGRPLQGVLGAISHPGNPSAGAYAGLTHREEFTPLQSILRAAGQNRTQAAKNEKALPAPVRFVGNTVGSIALDPTTYLTLGTAPEAEAAARSLAPEIAARRGLAPLEAVNTARETGQVTIHPAISDLAQQLLTKGASKVLTKEELKAAPKDLISKLTGPGAKFAGHTVPFTAHPNVDKVIQKLTEGDVNLALSTAKSGPYSALRPTQEIEQAAKDAYKAGKAAGFTPEQVDARVAKALDIGNTPADLSNLTSEERGLVGRLRANLNKTTGQNVNARLLQGEDARNAAIDQKIADVKGGPTYYRGTGAPADEVIRQTGLPWWDRHTFVADTPQNARLYGDQISEVPFKADAKILKAGTPQYDTIDQAVRAAHPGIEWRLGTYQHEQAIAQQAEKQGYDAVHFHDQGTTGTIVLNRGALAQPRTGGAASIEARVRELEASRPTPSNQYLPRTLTQESRDLLPPEVRSGETSGGVSGALKARTDETRNIPGSEVLNSAGNPAFESNPALATVRRIQGTNRDVAHVTAADQLRAIRNPDGTPFALAPGDAGYEQATAGTHTAIRVPSSVDPVTGERTAERNLLVPNDKAVEAKRAFGLAGRGPEQTAVVQKLKQVDQHFMRLYKGYATMQGPLSGGLLFRREISHIINGFYYPFGAKGLGYFFKDSAEAGRLQKLIHDAIKGGEEWSTRLSPSEKNLIDSAERQRVLQSGFFTDPLNTKSSEEAIAGLGHGEKPTLGARAKNAVTGKSGPLSPDNKVLTATRNANGVVDDNIRLALFSRFKKMGYSDGAAGKMTLNQLFDYTKQDAGSTLSKYVDPFFAWTRNNVPLQLATLARHPGRITSQVHILESLQHEGNLNPQAIPDWAREGGAVPLSGSGDNGQVVVPDLPFTSAAKSAVPVLDIIHAIRDKLVTGSTAPDAGSQLFTDAVNASGLGGPVVGGAAAGYQIAAGKNIFTGAPIKPGELVPLPSPFDKIPGIDKLVPGKKVPSWVPMILQAESPGVSKLGGATAWSAANFPEKLLSTLSGQTVTKVTPKTRSANVYNRLDRLDALVNWLKSQGIILPRGTYVTAGSSRSSGSGSLAGTPYG